MSKQKDKILETIFEELCKRVGVKFEDVDIEKEDWADQYSWELEEEIEYQVWLYNYLVNTPQAVDAIKILPMIGEDDKISKIVKNFCLFYGWALKDDEDEEEDGDLDEIKERE